MKHPKHILVGTDFSDVSHVALELARDYARAFGAKLTLLHIASAHADALGPVLGTTERMHVVKEVHEALSVLKEKATGVEVLHAEVLTAPHAASALCDYAASHDVDLIVVGAHGRSRLEAFLVGSVAERVLRHAPCSVLVARS